MHQQINPPTEAKESMALLMECRFALEPSVVKLLHAAPGAGWDRSTTVTALATLLVDFSKDKLASRRQSIQ